jgi:hypothetical protein
MSQVGISTDDKERFDELQPEDMTQAEFTSELLDAYEHQDEKVIIDTEAIINAIQTGVASEIELCAYRGTKEAIEETVIE